MKSIITKLSFCYFLFFLVGCDEGAIFTTPLPKNTESLSSFPKELIGEYSKLTDSSTLVINENSIIANIRLNDTLNILAVQQDSVFSKSMKISGDSLINLETNKISLLKKLNDSLSAYYSFYIDTLFLIGENAELKSEKNHYFLNRKYDDKWAIQMLDLNNGNLFIRKINQTDDIYKLEEITQQCSDSIKKFTLSDKQFYQFIEQNGFGISDAYKKLK